MGFLKPEMLSMIKTGAARIPFTKLPNVAAALGVDPALLNHLRYHESIGNLTPAGVYFGRGQTILLERERIKRDTIKTRRLQHRGKSA